MGIKSRGGGSSTNGSLPTRKRKSAATKENELKSDFLRKARLVLIQCNLKQQTSGVVAFCCVLVFLNILYFAPGGKRHLKVTVDMGSSAEGLDGTASQNLQIKEDTRSPIEKILSDLGGFGAAVPKESAFLKKYNIRQFDTPRSSVGVPAFTAQLARVEHEMNKGWNVSDQRVLPLGQLGYVKRDLPVYKDGLQRLDITVLARPKSGLYSTEQLQGDSYSSILCLSFNTDHCFDPLQHVAIGESRKVNRIQNLRDTVWSKHKFCKTMSDATKGLTDRDLLSFTFPCWVMPNGYDKMIKFSRENDLQTWIAKPRSLGAGMGIYIVNDYDSLERERSSTNVIQSYLESPHLVEKVGLDGQVHKYKWDARTYVLVTSVTPLRAYVYNRGLVRISTSPYSSDCKTNVTACLTNTSLNKKVEGAQLKDITWSFHKMKEYLAKQGEDPWEEVFLRLQRAIGLTLLSAESTLLKHFTPAGFRCKSCYQLLGVDVLFDDALQAKVVEINGEPNLKTTSNGKTHYDFTKKYMARDLTALVFNNVGESSKTAQRLMQWANIVAKSKDGKDKSSTALGEDHIEFVLSTIREHSKLGGFKPVYPNDKLSEPHGRFLRFLRDKEAAKGDALNSDEPLVHADGRRYRLHQILTTVLDTKALAEGVASGPAPEDPSPTSQHETISSSQATIQSTPTRPAKVAHGQTKPRVVSESSDEDMF